MDTKTHNTIIDGILEGYSFAENDDDVRRKNLERIVGVRGPVEVHNALKILYKFACCIQTSHRILDDARFVKSTEFTRAP